MAAVRKTPRRGSGTEAEILAHPHWNKDEPNESITGAFL